MLSCLCRNRRAGTEVLLEIMITVPAKVSTQRLSKGMSGIT